MRPRRSGLQVSTFPFLAVLLCAMGSLILLLLVIDRRAKVVARAKSRKAAAQRQEETLEVLRARQAEWEHRRQQLHAQLEDQKAESLGRLQLLNQKKAAQEEHVQNAHKQATELQLKLQEAAVLLQQEKTRLELQQRAAQLPDDQLAGSRTKLARLSADLVQLERTLADLRVARKKETKLYSVVPYQGKRGDNRKPVYLECQPAGVLIHPERKALFVSGGGMLTLRAEVLRRIPPEPIKKDNAEESTSTKAYLMFLVRPDGIATYYQSISALQGLPVDFGYEFLDADWQLDFPPDEQTPANQSWQTAKTTPFPSLAGQGAEAPRGLPRDSRSSPGGKTGTLPMAAGNGSDPRSARFGGAEGQAPEGPMELTGPFGFVPRARAGTALSADGPPVAGRGQGPGFADSAGDQQTVQSRGEPGQISGQGVRAELRPPSAADPVENPADTSTSKPTTDSGPSVGPLMATKPGESAGAGPVLDPPFAAPSPERPQSGIIRGETTSSSTAAGNGVAAPGRPTVLAPALSSGSGTPAERAGDEQSAVDPDGNKAQSAAEGQVGSPDPLANLSPPVRARNKGREKPVQPLILTGNRDWVITIECQPNVLEISPTQQRFTLEEIRQSGAAGNRLLKAIQSLIQRRQATVREGEPPYRPMVRFRVRPGGMRMYYIAYPILEALQIPMSHENFEHENAPKVPAMPRQGG